ncbi:TRAPP trafficking subunit Trs65-like protein [Pleurostoma richardsiae]|uniref:TRAPP trafficking subunit Trs65-like protein n=1 Tax=Pleurostoma richardsiae TaxID=41990 RepID=A0AA38VI80_9PEZI|nr:TRAPP trafficking subunit Trs65-like protein [Pleurostoma richardsiae]
MAVPERDEAPDGSQEDFIEHSFLSYMIPFATDFNLEQSLQQEQNGSSSSLFDSIPQRESLFFDETVDVYLVLRTRCRNEKVVRSYLKRLVLSLEAQIVNSHAPDRDGPPATEVIYTGSLEGREDPFIVADPESGGSDDDERAQTMYAVWKLPVFLTRPRIRLQAPSVVFSGSANLKSEDSGPSDDRGNGYLASGVPSGLNLLETFGNDPALGGITPRLSALRVSRVAPVTQAKDSYRPLRALPSVTLKIYPAVHTRVRFARPNATPPSPAIIALLEMDFTPFFDCETVLDEVNLSLPDGVADDLSQVPGLSLPLTCVAHDHVTFLYRLAPEETDVPSRSPTRELDISITCTALVQPGACTPKLRMAWATALDFTLPVNPGFGTSVPAPLQRAHRPSQLSISESAATSLISPSVSRPDALPGLEAAAARSTEANVPDFGITMTFSAPEGPVYPGEEFVWTVFVVNRSKEPGPTPLHHPAPAARGGAAIAAVPDVHHSQPRKLALFAVPKRRRNEVRVVRPPSTAGQQQQHARRSKSALAAAAAGKKGGADAASLAQEQQLADAVLDENVVHAMQRSSVVDSTEVVCLSADVRVGPLPPGACHVAELRFVALREGIVGVECVRVVDLGSQEHVDIRELPVMIVEGTKSREDVPGYLQ